MIVFITRTAGADRRGEGLASSVGHRDYRVVGNTTAEKCYTSAV